MRRISSSFVATCTLTATGLMLGALAPAGVLAADKVSDVHVTNPVLPVEISNADPIPVEVVGPSENPAHQAVTLKKFTTTNSFETIYTVPAGKTLVVEHVNCSALTDALYVGIFDGPLSHANIRYSVPVQSVSATVLIADGLTRLYFEAGSALNLRIFTASSTTCTISGYTVDALP